MTLTRLMCGLGVASALLISFPAKSASLIVEGGILTGARNINVNGTRLNVDFVDANCFEEFAGCDAVSDFDFADPDFGFAAGQALLEQVLIDSAAGLFDSDPTLTLGCTGVPDTSSATCFISFPVGGGNLGADFVPGVTVRNETAIANAAGSDTVSIGSIARFANDNPNNLTARFNTVPLPAPVWLMLSAMMIVAGMARRAPARLAESQLGRGAGCA